MAALSLSPAEVALLASCLHIGLKASPDPKDLGENAAAVAALLEELGAIWTNEKSASSLMSTMVPRTPPVAWLPCST